MRTFLLKTARKCKKWYKSAPPEKPRFQPKNRPPKTHRNHSPSNATESKTTLQPLEPVSYPKNDALLQRCTKNHTNAVKWRALA